MLRYALIIQSSHALNYNRINPQEKPIVQSAGSERRRAINNDAEAVLQDYYATSRVVSSKVLFQLPWMLYCGLSRNKTVLTG